MGLLDRAIRRGISEGVGNAVGGAIEKAVAPKAEQLANQTARQLEQAAQPVAQQTTQAASNFTGAFASLQRAAEGYATEMSKSMKICPACGQPANAELKFCPSCGTKLPAAIQEEQEAQANDAAVMALWDKELSQYPKWAFGGKNFNMEHYDWGILFAVKMESSFSAQNAIRQYRELLLQNGFQMAGEYPIIEHLYKMVNGICYHCDTEHCFDGDNDCPTLYFNMEEPAGGFDYVKPEPRKQVGLKDLFRL